MFAMALVLWSFDITNFVHEIKITLINDPDLPLGPKYDTATHGIFKLAAVLDLMYAYMVSGVGTVCI